MFRTSPRWHVPAPSLQRKAVSGPVKAWFTGEGVQRAWLRVEQEIGAWPPLPGIETFYLALPLPTGALFGDL